MADDMNHAAGNSGVPGAGAVWCKLNGRWVTVEAAQRITAFEEAQLAALQSNGVPGAGATVKYDPEKARFLAENNRLRDDARRFEAAYKRTMQKFEALKNELADRDAMIADMQCKSIDRIQRMADAAAKIEALEAELAALKAKPSTRDNADVASTLLRAVEKYSENEEIANLEKELAERDDQIQTLRWELAALKASQSTPGLVQSTPSVDPGSQIAAFAGRWASRKLDGR